MPGLERISKWPPATWRRPPRRRVRAGFPLVRPGDRIPLVRGAMFPDVAHTSPGRCVWLVPDSHGSTAPAVDEPALHSPGVNPEIRDQRISATTEVVESRGASWGAIGGHPSVSHAHAKNISSASPGKGRLDRPAG